MTADDFKAWRHRMGWTQTRAAEALGITLRGVQKREAGEAPIDKEAEFATRYIEEHAADFSAATPHDPWRRPPSGAPG